MSSLRKVMSTGLDSVSWLTFLSDFCLQGVELLQDLH